jgi:conjugal transfer pilus assembly protein TraE
MRYKQFLESWRFVQAENRLHRIVLIGLVITNGLSALAASHTERAVVLVPPNLTKEVEIACDTESSELKESCGLYLAELLGNVTPANSEFLANAIKMDRVATSFKPRQVAYEQGNGKVFVTGELSTLGPNAKSETKNRTYEFIFSIRNYRPRSAPSPTSHPSRH